MSELLQIQIQQPSCVAAPQFHEDISCVVHDYYVLSSYRDGSYEVVAVLLQKIARCLCIGVRCAPPSSTTLAIRAIRDHILCLYCITYAPNYQPLHVIGKMIFIEPKHPKHLIPADHCYRTWWFGIALRLRQIASANGPCRYLDLTCNHLLGLTCPGADVGAEDRHSNGYMYVNISTSATYTLSHTVFPPLQHRFSHPSPKMATTYLPLNTGDKVPAL